MLVSPPSSRRCSGPWRRRCPIRRCCVARLRRGRVLAAGLLRGAPVDSPRWSRRAAPPGVRAGLDVGRAVLHRRADTRRAAGDAACRPAVTMSAIGGRIVLAGLALFLANPPVRARAEPRRAQRRRRPAATGSPRASSPCCAAAAATTMVLGRHRRGIVAMLRDGRQGRVDRRGPGHVGRLLADRRLHLRRAVPRRCRSLALSACSASSPSRSAWCSDRWWLLVLALLPAGALCAPTVAASADPVSRLVPSSARGEAMGSHGSSLTVGLALGAPLAGAAIDRGGPGLGLRRQQCGRRPRRRSSSSSCASRHTPLNPFRDVAVAAAAHAPNPTPPPPCSPPRSPHRRPRP